MVASRCVGFQPAGASRSSVRLFLSYSCPSTTYHHPRECSCIRLDLRQADAERVTVTSDPLHMPASSLSDALFRALIGPSTLHIAHRLLDEPLAEQES
jgi:hypothetical protein